MTSFHDDDDDRDDDTTDMRGRQGMKTALEHINHGTTGLCVSPLYESSFLYTEYYYSSPSVPSHNFVFMIQKKEM